MLQGLYPTVIKFSDRSLSDFRTDYLVIQKAMSELGFTILLISVYLLWI